MNTHKIFPAIFATIALGLFLVSNNTQAGSKNTSSNGKYSFQVESYGSSLPTHYWNGYTFIEGKKGQGYNIRVFNHSGKRIEAVVTVDGRDTISGEIGNYKKNRGYVIEAYDSVLIKGFRTSWSNVAGFYFTDIEDSYSDRMGSGQHVGVIGVAVFDEKRKRERRPAPIRIAPKKRRMGTGYGRGNSTGEASESLDTTSSYTKRGERRATRRPAAKQNIGTGYGNREYSPASQTDFNRKSRRPSAKLAIYYNDRESLIKQGVIRRPRPPVRRPTPNPFPVNNDQGFAPPPPASYYWE